MKFRKILRLFVLILLVILAVIGISIGGAAPVPNSKKNKDKAEEVLELVEDDKGVKEQAEEDEKN